ncbi:hypothetical protein, partial [Pectobacterium brasiliense]|uniref:hypothetical protein n=1 Tax=Pectobacterium brasiliense TaxID=180957 RepID=UPI001968BDDD
KKKRKFFKKTKRINKTITTPKTPPHPNPRCLFKKNPPAKKTTPKKKKKRNQIPRSVKKKK